MLEYIQQIGASGEFRSDQMARSVHSLYRVTVEKNLLYRTAKKAQEAVFGKNQSDVLALDALGKSIEDDGGCLKWVYGMYNITVTATITAPAPVSVHPSL